jgi:hypothetical protein
MSRAVGRGSFNEQENFHKESARLQFHANSNLDDQTATGSILVKAHDWDRLCQTLAKRPQTLSL